jgi:hypothetical protein
MERLFSPCTRLHDLIESLGRLQGLRRYHPEPSQELNLDVSNEELLSAKSAFIFADLFAMLGNKDTVAWLTPHAAVARKGGRAASCFDHVPHCYRFSFNVDGKYVVALALSPEHLLEICDIVVRLLAVSVAQSVCLSHWRTLDVFINAPTLAYLMEQCQSLKSLTLSHIALDEDHCRMLGDFSRPDLEIILNYCRLTSAGASALAEVLGRNQGPSKIDQCYFDHVVLADGLRGNSRLKSWRPRFSSDVEVRDRAILAIAGAVKENKGLVHLDLMHSFRMSDETWDAVCESLKTHPTLEVLDLWSTSAPAVLKSRIQALVDMVEVSMSMHTIHLHDRYSEHELFRDSVIPYLETNQFRPRVRAIQKTRLIMYRAKVLGQALLAVRTDANLFWKLLSGNAEVAFPSSATTIAAAANLAMPDTAAATSTSNVAAVVASAMSALTTNATGSLPTAAAAATTARSAATASDVFAFATTAAAAANVASPSATQKRKARP